jgi:hypothetical protein
MGVNGVVRLLLITVPQVLKRYMMVIGKTPRTRAGRSLRDTVHTAVCKVTRQLIVGLRNNNSLE